MTHDELLAMIDKQDHAIKIDGIGSEIEVLRLMGFRKTLRAVVELHKPVEGHEHLCSSCLFGDFLQSWPCLTIQAIEKELQ